MSINYKLLTPGPLTTSSTVRDEMLVDHCTWDDDYKQITQQIRKDLLKIAQVGDDYTAVLMQGSGTFGVESVITSAVGSDERVLILTNGAYGERIVQIARTAGVPHNVLNWNYDEVPQADVVRDHLAANPDVTHVAMVHCETTSGILNELEPIAKVVKDAGLTFIVDAMSSFGGIPIAVGELGIDFIISSANKCIQGVPGFSFIIARRDALETCKGKARSLSLDLYDQWAGMDGDGKWRYTSPTHTVLAFAQAIRELEAEGGVSARYERYSENNEILISGLRELGIQTYVGDEHQSPIITTFFYPEGATFSFQDMYDYIKERGYAIYPGKVTEADTFRIGNIGEIYPDDMRKVVEIIGEYLNQVDTQKGQEQ
ncbi:2-aminoethylphosphonate--pyruvate transaminase [Trueperella bialowiezensis]|uniref:2-aminoethylphosphonate--pyruvate transaminase n=1 Tax=Trueperella bialowiezensis TaxID=312285 RepID=A0A3S4V7A4_9ACTO|nr:2-aminoethylphosphonate--pyruvate transaminase [Trueperella bialowiezensis]VEI13598.1 2-aminoethylphosphonate--pyruvate transaminase [Trueperella bialowiezensis]